MRDVPAEQAEGRLHPARRHARRWLSRAEPVSLQEPDGVHHRGHDRVVSRGGLPQGAEADHGEHAADESRGGKPVDQVVELSEQHPGEDRGGERGDGRGDHAQRQGHVAECTGDNIFLVRNGKLETPPVSAGALIGITRQVVIELAAKRGIEASEPNLTRYDLMTADEVFLTGTAAEIVPVASIDGRIDRFRAPGPLTLKLTEDFRKLTRTDGALIGTEIEHALRHLQESRSNSPSDPDCGREDVEGGLVRVLRQGERRAGSGRIFAGEFAGRSWAREKRSRVEVPGRAMPGVRFHAGGLQEDRSARVQRVLGNV